MKNPYTHPNGVTIERLASGSFKATHPDWPHVLRSQTGTTWYDPDGRFIYDASQDRAALAAWYGWEQANEITTTPDPDGLTPTKRKAVEGAIRDAKDGKAVRLVADKCRVMHEITSRAGVYSADTSNKGYVFTHTFEPPHSAKYDVIWNAATGERTVPKPEPETYTGPISEWPVGLYERNDGKAQIAHIGEGQGLYRDSGGSVGLLIMTTTANTYTRIGDLDLSLLFTGGEW